MKKVFLILLTISLCLCFFGCNNSKSLIRTTETYTLISYGIQGNSMNQAELLQKSGGQYLYLKLHSDGTAEMKVTAGDPIQMEYADGLIWRSETPDITATYTIEDNTVTILDGAYTMVFRKKNS